MIKKLLIVPLFLLATTLSSCTFKDDESWKEKFGTPELFLNNAYGYKYVYKYYRFEDENKYSDTDDTILSAIKEAGPFEKSTEKDNYVERFFTYDGFRFDSTMGINYCIMSIWDDGYVQIHHKSALGPHSYLHFSIAEDKAIQLNDLVFNLLN